jgi:uncharacterized cupredoxin-like copper-binding protein
MRMRAIASRLSTGACRVAVTAVGVVAAGCGGAHGHATGSLPVVPITERDFTISAPKRLAAGDVILRVRNRGPVGHEMIIVTLDQAGLPLRRDGLTVNEDALQRRQIGVLEPASVGAVRDLHVRLGSGRYELFCNMSGHFMSGMHTTLVVR